MSCQLLSDLAFVLRLTEEEIFGRAFSDVTLRCSQAENEAADSRCGAMVPAAGGHRASCQSPACLSLVLLRVKKQCGGEVRAWKCAL